MGIDGWTPFWQEDYRLISVSALVSAIMRTTLMRMASGRQMRYPYTLGAQIKAFPFKFHWENCWLPKAWAGGIWAARTGTRGDGRGSRHSHQRLLEGKTTSQLSQKLSLAYSAIYHCPLQNAARPFHHPRAALSHPLLPRCCSFLPSIPPPHHI